MFWLMVLLVREGAAGDATADGAARVPPMVRVLGDGEVDGAAVEGAAGDGAAGGADGGVAAGDVPVHGSSDRGRFRQEELYLGGGAAGATESEDGALNVGAVGYANGQGVGGDAPGNGATGDAYGECRCWLMVSLVMPVVTALPLI